MLEEMRDVSLLSHRRHFKLIENTNYMKNIPDIPKEILDASSRGKLIIFVGAGVSRIIGCPSWREFAEKYLKDLLEKKIINYYEFSHLQNEEPRKLLSICLKIYKEYNLIPPKTGDILKADEIKLIKYPIYDDLYSFNAIYLTTNYDEYLDKTANKAYRDFISRQESSNEARDPIDSKRDYRIVSAKDDLLVSELKNRTIIHFHGSAENESDLVVTIVDYMNHYVKDSKPAVLLEEVFKSYTVLFVGYGLEEYEILEFMINKASVVPEVIQHYMLYPVFKTESQLLKFQETYYADLGIKLIPYPKDEHGYEQLSTVINEWAKQIGPIARPQMYYDKIKLIDEVI